MTSKKIEIEYGRYVQGYGWGSVNSITRLRHLVEHTIYNSIAVCGTGVMSHDNPQFTFGTLCPKCAKIRLIKSNADMEIMQPEYDWWYSSHEKPNTESEKPLADVTIKLSLREANEVKQILQETKELRDKVLGNQAIVNEYKAREGGDEELRDLQARYLDLESALRKFN